MSFEDLRSPDAPAVQTPPPDETTWLLVSGAPRSGTGLLRALVGDHPQVALLQEYGLTRLTRALDALVGRPRPINPPWRPFAEGDSPLAQAAAFYADLEEIGGYGSALEFADVGFDGMARAILGAVSGKRPRVIGDKLPMRGAWEDVEALRRRMPRLKLLIILRDPVAVIRSSMIRRARHRLGGDIWPIASVQEAADEWWSAMRRTADLVDRYEGDVHLVKYEALCADPFGVLAGVWRWLGLAPHDPAIPVRRLPAHIDPLDPGETEAVGRLVGAVSDAWRDEPDPGRLLQLATASPRPFELGRRHLASAENEGGVFGEGFSWREAWGRWTDGERAVMSLRHGLSAGQALLEIDIARAFTTAGRPCDVVVRLGSNMTQLFSVGGDASRLAMLCDLAVSSPPGLMEIELLIVRPKGVMEAPADERRLGLGVEAVTLTLLT